VQTERQRGGECAAHSHRLTASPAYTSGQPSQHPPLCMQTLPSLTAAAQQRQRERLRIFWGAENRSLKPITRRPNRVAEVNRAEQKQTNTAQSGQQPGNGSRSVGREAGIGWNAGKRVQCCNDRRPCSCAPLSASPAGSASADSAICCLRRDLLSIARQPHPFSPLCRECRRILRPTPHCRCRPVVTSESTSAIRPSSSTHSMSRRPWSVAAMTMESERAMGQLIECAHMRVDNFALSMLRAAGCAGPTHRL